VLSEAAEEEGNGDREGGVLDLNDAMSVGRFLRAKVSYKFYSSSPIIDTYRSMR